MRRFSKIPDPAAVRDWRRGCPTAEWASTYNAILQSGLLAEAPDGIGLSPWGSDEVQGFPDLAAFLWTVATASSAARPASRKQQRKWGTREDNHMPDNRPGSPSTTVATSRLLLSIISRATATSSSYKHCSFSIASEFNTAGQPVRAGHQRDTRRRDGPWQDGAIFLLSHAIPCVQIDRDIKVAVLYQIEERSSTLALFEIEHGSRTRLHSNCSILVL